MNTKSIVTLVGLVLIILGIIGFSYRYYTYTTTERVAQIGGLEVTAQEEKTVFISPVLSGLSIAAGLVLVIVGVSNRKR